MQGPPPPPDSACALRRASLGLIGKDDSAPLSRRGSHACSWQPCQQCFQIIQSPGCLPALLGGMVWITAEYYREHNFHGRCIKWPLARNLTLEIPWDLQPTPCIGSSGSHTAHFPIWVPKIAWQSKVLRRPHTPQMCLSLPYQWPIYLLISCNLETTIYQGWQRDGIIILKPALTSEGSLKSSTWTLTCRRHKHMVCLLLVVEMAFLPLTKIALQWLAYVSFTFSKNHFWCLSEEHTTIRPAQVVGVANSTECLLGRKGLGDEGHSPERENRERSGKIYSTQWTKRMMPPEWEETSTFGTDVRMCTFFLRAACVKEIVLWAAHRHDNV